MRLTALPGKNVAGQLMASMIGAALSKHDDGRMERELERRHAEQQREMDLIQEDVRILQGKLLLFKRFMIENDLLKQANESINGNSNSRINDCA